MLPLLTHWPRIIASIGYDGEDETTFVRHHLWHLVPESSPFLCANQNPPQPEHRFALSHQGRGEIFTQTEEASGEVGKLSAIQSLIHAPAQPKSKSSKRHVSFWLKEELHNKVGRRDDAETETEEASGEVEQVSAMQSPIHAPAQPKS